MKIAGVYKITHVASECVYVGSSVNIQRRLKEHRHQLANNLHGNQHLQKAWNKYGEGEFCFSILEDVADLSTLLAREQFWMGHLKSSCRPNYNMLPTAGNALGFRHTPETKARISRAGLGNKRSLGQKRSAKTIELMAVSLLGNKRNFGKVASQRKRDLIAAAHTGMKRSAESRLKMSIAAKNRVRGRHSPETVEKIRLANTGKRHSPEAIQKMKDSRRSRALD